MPKTWTKVKHDHRFDLGRAILINLAATLFFAAAAPFVLYEILSHADHREVLKAILLVPICCFLTIRFFRRLQESLAVWFEWKAFLRELDEIETVDTTFFTHDL